MAVLLAHQAVTNPATVVGSDQALDVHGTDEVRIECYHAFNQEGTNTNPQSFWIQTSLKTSGNDDWLTAFEFTASTGSPVIEALTRVGGEVVGATAMGVADEAGSAAGDLIYIRDTVANDSEWAYVREVVVNTSIDLVDGLTTAHAATTTSIFTLAEKFCGRFNVKGIQRVRCVYMNEGVTAMDTHIQAEIVLIA